MASALNMLDKEYIAKHKQRMSRLENDTNWQQLEPEQRYAFLDEQLLRNDQRPKINVQTTDDVLATLSVTSLHNLRDRIAALTGRFDQVLQGAAKAMEPEVKFIQVPHRTLKSADDLEAWLQEVKSKLSEALKKGPVHIE